MAEDRGAWRGEQLGAVLVSRDDLHAGEGVEQFLLCLRIIGDRDRFAQDARARADIDRRDRGSGQGLGVGDHEIG